MVDSKEGSGNCPLHGEVKRNECILVWCWLNPDTGLRQEVLVTSHVLLRKCFKTILNELSVCRQSVGNSNIWQVVCNLSIMCLIPGHINFGQFIALLVQLLSGGRLPTQSSIEN